jgi:hypothetical protein
MRYMRVVTVLGMVLLCGTALVTATGALVGLRVPPKVVAMLKFEKFHGHPSPQTLGPATRPTDRT